MQLHSSSISYSRLTLVIHNLSNCESFMLSSIHDTLDRYAPLRLITIRSRVEISHRLPSLSRSSGWTEVPVAVFIAHTSGGLSLSNRSCLIVNVNCILLILSSFLYKFLSNLNLIGIKNYTYVFGSKKNNFIKSWRTQRYIIERCFTLKSMF